MTKHSWTQEGAEIREGWGRPPTNMDSEMTGSGGEESTEMRGETGNEVDRQGKIEQRLDEILGKHSL